MNWLKTLFSKLSGTDTDAVRIAAALSGMADDMEQARSVLRQQFGLDDLSWTQHVACAPPTTLPAPLVALPPAAPVVPDVLPAPVSAPVNGTNGHAKPAKRSRVN